jgi:hypothetical protein
MHTSPEYSSDPLKAVVDHWRQAGRALELVREQELRQRDNARARREMHDVLELAGHLPFEPRLTSGLVQYRARLKRIFERP